MRKTILLFRANLSTKLLDLAFWIMPETPTKTDLLILIETYLDRKLENEHTEDK